jgi:membrane protein involved in D-alanine export
LKENHAGGIGFHEVQLKEGGICFAAKAPSAGGPTLGLIHKLKTVNNFPISIGKAHALLYHALKETMKTSCGWTLPISRIDAQSAFIFIGSLFILKNFVGVFNIDLVVLVLGLSVIYGYLRGASRLTPPEKSIAHWILIFAIALIFLFRKPNPLFHTHSGLAWLPALGIAYLALKLISFILDASLESAENRSWISFMGYCLFAPTYLAGPIFDYRFFRRQLAISLTGAEWSQMLLQGARRIILGLFKINVLSYIASHYTFYAWPPSSLATLSWAKILAIIDLALLQLYFNFSGYTDLAIGVSNCLGLSMPENFDKPFLSRNLRDFWNRWHISLAEWFRTFIFIPLNRQLLRFRFFRRRPLTASGMAILATFLLMGLWHGAQMNYLLYGLLHGVGFVILFMYGNWFKIEKVKYPPLRLAADLFARLLTFHYLALALLVFYTDSAPRWHLLSTVLKRLVN